MAYKAARPVVEQDARSQGKTTTRDEVKTAVRTAVSTYASKYGVVLPAKVVVGSTPLQAAAADICGSFSMPWSSFLPPGSKQVIDVARKTGTSPESWFKRIFGKHSAAGPLASPAPKVATATPTATPAAATAVPATAAPQAATAATAATAAGSDDSLGAWMQKLNPLYWFKSDEESASSSTPRGRRGSTTPTLQKQAPRRQRSWTPAKKALEAKQAVAAAQARSAELEAQLKSIETQVSGACVGKATSARDLRSASPGAIGPAEIVGADRGRARRREGQPLHGRSRTKTRSRARQRWAKAREAQRGTTGRPRPHLHQAAGGKPLSRRDEPRCSSCSRATNSCTSSARTS